MSDIKAIQEMLSINVGGNKICALCATPIPPDGLCKCAKESRDKEEERIKLFLANEKEKHRQLQAEILRTNGISQPNYKNFLFDADDLRHPDITDKCKCYVDNWDIMRDNNMGLLFCGQVGTGKTFYAGCIANALIDKLVPVLVTSFSEVINSLQALSFGEDRNGIYRKLQEPDLLILDDCGVEYITEYVIEKMFLIIDARYRSNKPLIVTTNLTSAELTTNELKYARIYDRILENSLQIPVTGASRRLDIAARKQEQFNKLLGFTNKKND
jgi:DNA replication protein DnaC